MLKINNLSINAVTIGDPTNPAVLMLHGWGANVNLVTPLAEMLAPLGYYIYALDLPGFGESEPPETPWTVHDYVNFVLAYMDHHHLDAVHLFGHSFGGRLGLILGADHANRIQTMALADAAGIRTPTPFSIRVRTAIYKNFRNGLSNLGLKNLSGALHDRYNRRYGSADFQATSGIMRQTFIHIINEDLREYAARVQVPTLLFWGEQDEDTPLWQGQLLEEMIPDAGLVVYPGSGHYSYLENLTQTARAMHELFRTKPLP